MCRAGDTSRRDPNSSTSGDHDLHGPDTLHDATAVGSFAWRAEMRTSPSVHAYSAAHRHKGYACMCFACPDRLHAIGA